MLSSRYYVARIAVLRGGHLAAGTGMAQETYSLINRHVLFFALGMAAGAIKVGGEWVCTVLKDVVARE
jgi:hypothetical protein